MSAATWVAHAAETIRARWEHNVESDPQTEAAQALEDTCQLLDPEVAAELERLRVERDRYRTAWRMARTRAISTGGAADRYAARARDAQEALQHMLFAVIASQLGRKAATDEIAALKAERHTTNEALSDAAEQLRVDRDRIAELEKRDAIVAEFVAARAEVITAIRNCHPDNGHDYDRWQGHAESRRQLAESLGLPVAWPPEGAK
ncbi:hypothetical protein [Streptomyces scabiei]|uniref:hypothetical protein n=1 Tax=Streptomyces scabiei TaxID=1930 RepID=UPI0007659608|nr:hypothetical protein [Streptomyces scabiei]